jgi:hypothetical protein
MKLVWKSICYKCEAPLNPNIEAHDHLNYLYIIGYHNIRPSYMDFNRMCYTSIGCKMRRVCYGCFSNPIEISPKSLRNREIGHLKNITRRSLAKTEKEIVHWFDGLSRQVNKNKI